MSAREFCVGCGTGSLSALLAEDGHRVDGVDSSPAMLARARVKTDAARFHVADAARVPLPAAGYDVVLARHVLWAVPDPEAALDCWVGLLRPGGRLVLVEGRWHTGVGLDSAECERLVRARRDHVAVTPLTDPVLWGGQVTDERYLLLSQG